MVMSESDRAIEIRNFCRWFGYSQGMSPPPMGAGPDRAQAWWRLGGVYEELALVGFAIGRDAGEVLWHLRKMGQAHLAMYESHPNERRPGASEWEFLDHFGVIVAFGDEKDRSRLARLASGQYLGRNPDTWRGLKTLLPVLLGWLAGDGLDRQTLSELQRACGGKKASRDDVQSLLPLVEGALALDTGNGGGLNAAAGRLLATHEVDAAGDLKDLSRRFMCLNGLWLVRLGLERNIKITVDSPYVPVKLIEQAWKNPPTTAPVIEPPNDDGAVATKAAGPAKAKKAKVAKKGNLQRKPAKPAKKGK
jgi:hypothetical protein